jgi:hypothetical protein
MTSIGYKYFINHNERKKMCVDIFLTFFENIALIKYFETYQFSFWTSWMKSLDLAGLFDEIGEMIRVESSRQAAIERNGKDCLVKVLAQTITDLMMHVSKKLLVKIPIGIDDPIKKLILKKLEPCKGICIKCSVGRLTGLCL